MFENFNVSVAIYKPEKPANTGNIGRICVGLNTALHIVGRPSFLIRDKELIRAGLDYWEKLKLVKHDDDKTFFEYAESTNSKIIPVSKFGKKRYDLLDYKKLSKESNLIFLFGRESSGLRETIFDTELFETQINENNLYKQTVKEAIYIPMSEDIRSINLSNSVAVVLYEAFKNICLN